MRVVIDGTITHLDELHHAAHRRHVRQRAARRRRPPRRCRRQRAAASPTRSAPRSARATAIASSSSPRRFRRRSRRKPSTRLRFTERYECANDGTRAPSPTPQLFSFNNPRGACRRCNGFGATLEYDEALIVPYPTRTLRDGAIDPWTKPRYDNKRRALAEFAKRERHLDGHAVAEAARRGAPEAAHGEGQGLQGHLPVPRRSRGQEVQAVHPRLPAAVSDGAGMPRLSRHQAAARGAPRARRRPQHRRGERAAGGSPARVDSLASSSADFERQIARTFSRRRATACSSCATSGSATSRSNRATRTLSGGEAQRIGLANSLGSQLVDTLYVLDEPSIGLHPRDMDRLLRLLHRLRDGGNTVLVVEHDLEAIRAADYMVELGPGERRARAASSSSRDRSRRIAESPLTGAYLTGAKRIPVPAERRRARTALDHAHRRARAQPQGRRHQDPARRRDGGDRRLRHRQEHARTRRAASRARDAAARRAHAPSSTSARRVGALRQL